MKIPLFADEIPILQGKMGSSIGKNSPASWSSSGSGSASPEDADLSNESWELGWSKYDSYDDQNQKI